MWDTSAVHLWSYLCTLLPQKWYYNKCSALAPDDTLSHYISLLCHFVVFLFKYKNQVAYGVDLLVRNPYLLPEILWNLLNVCFQEYIAGKELTPLVQICFPYTDTWNLSPIERIEEAEAVVQWFGPEDSGVHSDCLSGKQPSLYCNRDWEPIYMALTLGRKNGLRGGEEAWKQNGTRINGQKVTKNALLIEW